MRLRECQKLWLISISNIRLLLVAVPSYYWYPPSHPSVLISSHFWHSDSSPSLRPASARKYCCSERRERRGEDQWRIDLIADWGLTGDDCSNYFLKQNWFLLSNLRWECAAGCYWNFPIVGFMGLIEYRRTLTDFNSVISSAGIRFYFWIKFFHLYICYTYYSFLHSVFLL